MATDSTGGTTLDKCQLDSSVYPTTDGSTQFIPHVNQKYKIVLYKNSTDADANTTGNADWVINAVEQPNTISNSEIIFETVAAMVASTTLSIGDHVRTLGYTAIGDGGGNEYDIVAAATGTDDGGSYIDLATHQAKGLFPGGVYNVEQWGAVGDGVTDNTAAVLAAKAHLRHDPVTILDTIGGNNITAYSSGELCFGVGVFNVSADTLLITQDLGLKLKGKGSRRTNNAVSAPTAINFTGTSSGYGIKVSRSGGRGFTVEDMDLTYNGTEFTGHIVDIIDSPGANFKRVFIGTNGITGATRKQTALSCVRLTYHEFTTFEDCVFDGAVDFIWIDDVRTELGNTFGGFGLTLSRCTFYDCTGDMIRHDGLRTTSQLSIKGCAFNPIAVDPVRAIDIDNVDGFALDNCQFTPSVANKPSSEWINITNSTGSITSNAFGDLANLGNISGNITFSSNRVFCTDGLVMINGVIKSFANEFSKCTNGYRTNPSSAPLVFNIGPDLFKAAVTRSIYVPADNSLLSGMVNYSSEQDSSTSKFSNTSSRVSIVASDKANKSISNTSYTIDLLDTGRTIVATGGSAQTWSLPAPQHGCEFTIAKVSSQDFSITTSAGKFFYGVGTTYPTSAALTGSQMGVIKLKAYDTAGWIVLGSDSLWSYT
jgi:hypothetical protein